MTFSIPQSLDKHLFKSAQECVEHLAVHKEAGHLFRGESRFYPMTCPGTRRVLDDKQLHFQEQTFFLDLAGHFEDWFCDYTGQADLRVGQMFLQHYGIPTDLLDFSSDPEIAVFFASLSHLKEVGLICTMDPEVARRRAKVFSLSDDVLIPGLEMKRPRKQKAYALLHESGLPYDLKSEEAREVFGLRWYGFYKSGSDHYVRKYQHILDADNDKAALFVMAYASDLALNSWQPAGIGVSALWHILSQMVLSTDRTDD